MEGCSSRRCHERIRPSCRPQLVLCRCLGAPGCRTRCPSGAQQFAALRVPGHKLHIQPLSQDNIHPFVFGFLCWQQGKTMSLCYLAAPPHSLGVLTPSWYPQAFRGALPWPCRQGLHRICSFFCIFHPFLLDTCLNLPCLFHSRFLRADGFL